MDTTSSDQKLQKAPRPSVHIIAAMDSNRAIGKDNQLLFRIKEDFEWMKSQTKGHPIIMGRLTAESIGRPLPNRTNIVISRNPDVSKQFPPPYITVTSLEEGIATAAQMSNESIFIFGGASIYHQALPLADRLFLTIVDTECDADSFFPSYEEFSHIEYEKASSDNQYRYRFLILSRPLVEA